MKAHHAFGDGLPPVWAIRPTKSLWQWTYDLIGSPLRMIALPDSASERLHLTSLRAERMAKILPHLRGRVLDVGAGDNALIRTYQAQYGISNPAAAASIGVDVVDWGGGATLITSAAQLPFEDQSFDTVCFIACLNHIPERQEALLNAQRLLRPGGRLIITMISHRVGALGHRLWWYSEEKHRHVDADELPGMDQADVLGLLKRTGFARVRLEHFLFGMNTLYLAFRNDDGIGLPDAR